jgi:hypothetical protein
MYQNESLGKLLRTFNIPKDISNHKSELGKFLTSCEISIPKEFLQTPSVLSLYLQEILKGKEFEFELEKSGIDDYPYNIKNSKLLS